ncbi:alanine dehydrogenase [Bacilliculturomica massiliensis]|uniref:alanine dehydrogenase n=1 Tax=Bacilliculturomica massiliensis TaxID=1917867 RepID=UPI0010300BD7|nr:alanine dehydrogenase [Bacilliculturomica massiliensis]
MKIGLLKEIKEGEYRVGMIPSNVRRLADAGHQVFVEKDAGRAAGFEDGDYSAAGASVLPTPEAVYDQAELIIKVKEILPPEHEFLKDRHIVFTYIHSANRRQQTQVLLEKKLVAFAYEDVMDERGEFPLLTPMSEMAGDVGVLYGVHYMMCTRGGNGTLICGAPGVPPAKVVVFGGGNVGLRAAKMAAALGAQVTIMDTNIRRMREINASLLPEAATMYSNKANIIKAIADADMVVNAVKWFPGLTLISRDMLAGMKPNSLIVDIDAEPNGAIETCRYSTHEDPVYYVDGIRHLCVPNLPSAVAQSASAALSNATIPYILDIANKGWKRAAMENGDLIHGLDFVKGMLTFKPTAEAFGIPYVDVMEALGQC